MAYEQELKVALAAVEKAASLCSQVQQTLITEETVIKKDKSPVTVADLGSQAVICHELQQEFGSDPIVAEEDIDTLQSNKDIANRVHQLVAGEISKITHAQMIEAIALGKQKVDFTKRYWTIDPIDGTKGFLRKDQYAIALALIENGRVVLGVLGCPNYAFDQKALSGPGSLFYGVKNQGAFVRELNTNNSQAITTDSISEGSRAKFCESVESAHAAHDEHAKIAKALNISTPPFRIDSQAKYASVARGDASIYLRLPRSSSYREKIWDHAAGAAIVEQAGGRVSDFSGKPLDFTCGETLEKNVGILATNGKIHDQVLAAIQDQISSSRT